MAWTVYFHPAFEPEFASLDEAVQDELLSSLRRLQRFGPMLGRPHADTLAGSRHANMKELRFSADGGVWRAAFAFDPDRQAIVLVLGSKAGVGSDRFYKLLVRRADERFDQHLRDRDRQKS